MQKAQKKLIKIALKGSDRAMVQTQIEGESLDEIKEYEDPRSVGACEASWHIFGYALGKKWPPVSRMNIL